MPLILFLSDFGCGSPYVGHVHLVVEALTGGRVRVVDVAHDIPSFDVRSGAYILYSTLRFAPEGSVFLVVVDPGVGTQRRPLIIQTRRFYFVGPDNGVLWPAASRDGLIGVYEIDVDKVGLKPVSHTFHGRDVFAPTAAMLALGVPPSRLARRKLSPEEIVKVEVRRVERVEGKRFCMDVVYIDKFGNVALSATREDRVYEEACSTGRVSVCSKSGCIEAKCVRTFAEAGVGEAAIYYNSFDFLEVAVFMGSAAKALEVSVGDEVCVESI